MLLDVRHSFQRQRPPYPTAAAAPQPVAAARVRTGAAVRAGGAPARARAMAPARAPCEALALWQPAPSGERALSAPLSEGAVRALAPCLDWLLAEEATSRGGGGGGGVAPVKLEPFSLAHGPLLAPPPPAAPLVPPPWRCLDRTHAAECTECVRAAVRVALGAALAAA